MKDILKMFTVCSSLKISGLIEAPQKTGWRPDFSIWKNKKNSFLVVLHGHPETHRNSCFFTPWCRGYSKSVTSRCHVNLEACIWTRDSDMTQMRFSKKLGRKYAGTCQVKCIVYDPKLSIKTSKRYYPLSSDQWNVNIMIFMQSWRINKRMHQENIFDNY